MPINESPDNVMLRQISTQVENLIRDGSEQRQILRDHQLILQNMNATMAKFAVIEERQSTAREGLERAFQEIRSTNSMIDELDTRVKYLEIAHPANKAAVGVVQKISWLVVSAVVGALLVLVLQRPVPSAHNIVPGAMPNISTK